MISQWIWINEGKWLVRNKNRDEDLKERKEKLRLGWRMRERFREKGIKNVSKLRVETWFQSIIYSHVSYPVSRGERKKKQDTSKSLLEASLC